MRKGKSKKAKDKVNEQEGKGGNGVPGTTRCKKQ